MLRALLIMLLAAGLVGCGQSKRTEVVLATATLTNQLQMQSGDSCLFRLPSGDTLAVWCERPRSFLEAAKPADSKSGLRTVWGEAPFRAPKEILVKVGTNNHYAVAGWKSYITPGTVTVMGSIERRYELQAGSYRFLIIEDLQTTNCLPVKIIAGRK
jgi:hypothetical protein